MPQIVLSGFLGIEANFQFTLYPMEEFLMVYR